jgi:hypothetical protein
MTRYLNFDTPEDVVVSLELSAHLLTAGDVTTNVRWKWVIVAMHDALQGSMAGALSARHITGGLAAKSTRNWIASVQNQRGGYPYLHTAEFGELLKRVRDPNLLDEPLVLNDHQADDLDRLHRYRNDFAHFKPESWSIAFDDLPRMVSVAVEATDHLMHLRAAFISEDQGSRLQAALKTIRANLDRL